LLRNRLSLTELLKRHPEIESIPIEKPFIVVGMPRSGTTHLVNLLAADPRRRALPYWESQEPLPIPGNGPDVFGVDPRYTRAKNEHDAMMVSAPVTAAMHDRFRGDRGRGRILDLTSPPTCWNGMRGCPGLARLTLASTRRATTVT
jgi:hypothetical protein